MRLLSNTAVEVIQNLSKESGEKESIMNARSYRVNLVISPLDFPSIMGLGETSVDFYSEPVMINNKVLLMVTKTYVLIDMNTNKKYEVLSAQSIYEIPPSEIKSAEDIYEFYKDALLTLNAAYQYTRTQLPSLPNRSFANQPIEDYQKEIDRVFNLLNSRN